MDLVVRVGGVEYETCLEVANAASPVGAIVEAIGGESGSVVTVDGRLVSGSVPVDELGLGNGSVVEIHPTTPQAVETHQRHGVFNRPPRLVARAQRPRLEPPQPPPQPAKPMRFGWGALVVPLLLGLGMAVLIHPRMAAFALFSPAMLLANWVEDRRRLRREKRESGEVFAESLERFRMAIAAERQRELALRMESAVTPEGLVTTARRVDPHLWERRPSHSDFLAVPVGLGCLPWDPPVDGPMVAEVAAAIRPLARLHDIPIHLRLGPGEVVGIAGRRRNALGIARQMILQVAVNHGPADLAISVFTERPDEWDWAKWLPHLLLDGMGRRRLAVTPAEIDAVVAALPGGSGDDERRSLLVVDLPDLSIGARAKIREAIQRGGKTAISAITLAGRAVDLPSVSTTIVSTERDRSHVRFPGGSEAELGPWVMTSAAARQTARSLARVEDPEVAIAGDGLPGVVHLGALLGLGNDPAPTIAANWRKPGQRPGTPIGISAAGPLRFDFVSDGPHALLAGTTGAGKSELLRSLVAGLASSVSPEALNFVLIDYKGGSAFDACASLPHTVGLVTDLDEHLARRALVCLEAELRYREQRLRSVAVSDIDSYPRGAASLPRLLVVVDEFAALAAEHPDFMDALVGIAQRGRSLGVHLLLATQRPAGVISDNIKANTNLRIALRVQDVADSVDVIGAADAAAISRSWPGRGLVRRGPDDVVGFQAALVTGFSLSSAAADITVYPFTFGHEQVRPVRRDEDECNAPTDLELIARACREVAIEMHLEPARAPWPDPLPVRLYRQDLQPGQAAAYALADEPHRQRQVAVSWAPAAGNLLLYGLPGSGTTTTLGTIAVALAATLSPDRTHIYVLDFDDQQLVPLSRLPHVGSVVSGSDRERQQRLLRRLGAELQDRKRAVSSSPDALDELPTIVTLLDNYGGFADCFGDPADLAIHNLMARLVADGPGVGMMTILTAKQPGDIPTRVAAAVSGRLVFRLADRYDYSGLGVSPTDPPAIPGRAFESGSDREIQVALPHREGLAAAVDEVEAARPRPAPWRIGVLPSRVSVAEFVSAGRIAQDEWFLPLGIGDTGLVPSGLMLRDGEHALITGPPRSGKTTALVTLARVAKAANPDLHIVAVIPRRSELLTTTEIDDVLQADQLVEPENRPFLLLIDDAELVEDGSALTTLVKRRNPLLRIVAAGSADAIRGFYGHWTQDLRRSRIGCALRPNIVADGDLWQTQLPRHQHQSFPAGRGYLLTGGNAELIQLGHG